MASSRNLVAGRTWRKAAATLGVVPTAAKSHLENIFATGVARQADLMRLATGRAPPQDRTQVTN